MDIFDASIASAGILDELVNRKTGLPTSAALSYVRVNKVEVE